MRPAKPQPTPNGREQAFTLIELTVVIGIIAILAAGLIPTITQPYIQERRAEVGKEMGAIEEAIRGRPELGDYGYLGTIGTVPPRVSHLLMQNVPTYTGQTNPSLSTGGVPRGWQGPYVRVATQAPMNDPWGREYDILTNGATVNVGTPAVAYPQLQWQIRSAGPDGTPNTADDIYYPYDATTYFNAYALTLTVDVYLATGPSVRPVPDNTAITLKVTDGLGGECSHTDGALNSIGGRVTFKNSGSAGTAGCTKIPLGMNWVTFSVNGTTYNRPVLANQPVSLASVYVNSVSGGFTPASCTFTGSAALATTTAWGCTVPQTISVAPNQVLEATYSGLIRSTVAGKRCWVAIQMGTGAGFGGPLTSNDLSADPTLAAGVTTLTAAYSPFFTARKFQYTGTLPATITPALVIQPEAGGGCAIDPGGALQVATWAP